MVCPPTLRQLFFSMEELPGYLLQLPGFTSSFYTSDGRLFTIAFGSIYEEMIGQPIIYLSRECLSVQLDLSKIVFAEMYNERRLIWTKGNVDDVPTLC
jgi:hypothetical protein